MSNSSVERAFDMKGMKDMKLVKLSFLRTCSVSLR